MQVSKDAVIAFRLNGQGLSERADQDGLIEAAGRCGVQNTPPGSALLSLHARVHDLTRERMDEAVCVDKNLLQSWCMRGAPFFFPTADAPIFTTGVLPPTEQAMRHFIPGVVAAVDRLGIPLAEAAELAGDQISDVLAGRQLAIDELGACLAERIASMLPTRQREIWQEEGPYAAGQPLGQAVVHFCVRVLTLQGVVCFAPRADNKAPFVLVEEWLDRPIPAIDPQSARAELARRYLRCHGPSTRTGLAAWLGLHVSDIDPWWSPIHDELTPVDFSGKTWILTEDLDALQAPAKPNGVRLLPPHDPYTQLRDRETIVDGKYHREIWPTIGRPGAVLADGRIIGTWRPNKSGHKLTMIIKAFDSPGSSVQDSLQAEARQIAALRGASSVDVQFDNYR